MKTLFGHIGNYFRNTDKLLFFLVLATSLVGLLLVFIAFQAPDTEDKRTVMFTIGDLLVTRQFLVQCIAILIGFIAAIIISLIDYEAIASIWWIIAPVCIILVALTYFIGVGTDTVGADDAAWLKIPGLGLTIQPSELMKIGFIITFSYHVSKVGDKVNTLKHLALLLLHGAVPILMVLKQGDDGTALVFMFMFVAMLFAAGLKLRFFVIAIALVIIAVPFLWQHLGYYQQQRFMIFYHPEDDPLGYGYQQYQSRMMIGSGQLFGRGTADSGQVHLPERQNDFIFSVAGETFGFVGALVVLGLLVAIMMRLLRIAGFARDIMGKIICVGMFAIIAAQTIINVGMNLCLMPVIGVTLPFLSAGGTSTATLFLGVGLALSVSMNSRPHGVIGGRQTRYA